MSVSSDATAGGELVIERVLDAPRELVFRMWSEPGHFRNWAAPVGMKVAELEMDFRPGGAYRVCLASDDGSRTWIKGRFGEIDEPERFTLVSGFEDADGNVGHETLMTVTLEAIGDRTKLTLRQGEFDSTQAMEGSRGGWNEVLDSLVEYVGSERKTANS